MWARRSWCSSIIGHAARGLFVPVSGMCDSSVTHMLRGAPSVISIVWFKGSHQWYCMSYIGHIGYIFLKIALSMRYHKILLYYYYMQLDCDQQLLETILSDARLYVAQNSNFNETGSYFTEKMSSCFPSDVLRLLHIFIEASCLPTTTRCCSCSFDLQAAYVLLSGTSLNHRLRQSSRRTSEGKPEDILLVKYDRV